MSVSSLTSTSCSPFWQFVEAISNKQGELDNYIAEGYKNALSEERRRYCFLVDRQCAVAKNSSAYHGKVSGDAAAAHRGAQPLPHSQSVWFLTFCVPSSPPVSKQEVESW